MSQLLEPTENELERICDASWTHGAKGGDGVVFHVHHARNACNHTLKGTIDVAGVLYGFHIDNGDWGGTEVREWGLEDDVATHQEPEPAEAIAFVPASLDQNNQMKRNWQLRTYAHWRKTWLKEHEGKYNYDRHFSPGGKTEKYWREIPEKRGLTTGLLSDFMAGLSADEKKLFA